jgi:methyl-accepting chemotaxis protein
MDQVTQQNAAMVEQSTAASHSLAGEAEALAKLVAQFQIGAIAEPVRATSRPRPPAPKAPAARAKASPARAATSPKPVVAEAEEEWASF